MSEEPLPGDEVEKTEDRTGNEALVKFLEDAVKTAKDNPQWDNGFVVLTKGAEKFVFTLTEDISILFLLGALTVIKTDLAEQMIDEHAFDYDGEEDDAPPAA